MRDMQTRIVSISLLFTMACIVLATWCALAFADDGGSREIGRTTEKEITVVLSSSVGSVFISKGESEKILIADGVYKDEADPGISIDYAVRNRVGYMDLTLGEGHEEGEHKKGSFKISDVKDGKWYLKYSDAIPISFDVELGVGNGDFDLSGLQVKDFNLSTGASDVNLSFDQPNKSTIDNINIETGVSKFHGRNLGNANFKRFTFKGGVGSYTLDFNGSLKNEVDIDIEVGLGLLTVIIPDDVGAKIYCDESWISRLNCDKDFHATGDNSYLSDNFETAAGKMNIRIDNGLGSVKIRRR